MALMPRRSLTSLIISWHLLRERFIHMPCAYKYVYARLHAICSPAAARFHISTISAGDIRATWGAHLRSCLFCFRAWSPVSVTNTSRSRVSHAANTDLLNEAKSLRAAMLMMISCQRDFSSRMALLAYFFNSRHRCRWGDMNCHYNTAMMWNYARFDTIIIEFIWRRFKCNSNIYTIAEHDISCYFTFIYSYSNSARACAMSRRRRAIQHSSRTQVRTHASRWEGDMRARPFIMHTSDDYYRRR